ncbi:unnamed protein product [Pleuronectes platessa]|uniref:Uncharacterized protein n=1 Tax=Pleuronectes platessa TaxID=8262 RepID=A0A9N7V0Y2_PLEPL|nr:unnamed protein product [Pleuronectes platessa]
MEVKNANAAMLSNYETLKHLLQPGQDLLHLFGGEQLCLLQSPRVRFAPPDISVPHPLVIRDGRVELLHDWVGVSHEATQLASLRTQRHGQHGALYMYLLADR